METELKKLLKNSSYQILISKDNLNYNIILELLEIFEPSNIINTDRKYPNYIFYEIKKKYSIKYGTECLGIDFVQLIRNNNKNITWDKLKISQIRTLLQNKGIITNPLNFLIGTKVLEDKNNISKYADDLDLWSVALIHKDILWDNLLFGKAISKIDCFKTEIYNFKYFQNWKKSFEYKKLDLLKSMKISNDAIFLFAPYFTKKYIFNSERKRNGHGGIIDETKTFYGFDFLLQNKTLDNKNFLKTFFENYMKITNSYEKKGYNKGYSQAYTECIVKTICEENVEINKPKISIEKLFL